MAVIRCSSTSRSRPAAPTAARRRRASVLLVARQEERLAEAAESVSAAGSDAGGRARHLALDVTHESAGDHMLAAAQQGFGPPDVLVNNAGAARWRDLDEVAEEDWRA